MTNKEAYIAGWEEGLFVAARRAANEAWDVWAHDETAEISWEESDCKTQSEETDPTPYCSWCGAKTKAGCGCGPISPDD